MRVKLADILEGMEFQSEESYSYLNRETGEIVYVSREMLAAAEDDEEGDDLPGWQKDELKIANNIIENVGKYAQLPTSWDIHEYDIIERFCYSLPDQNQRDFLLGAIRGSGAFRRFRDNIERLGITQKWYAFRDEAYKDIAKEFCENNSVDYVE